jgi:hypothetical protein
MTSERKERLTDTRAQNCRRAYAYAVASGDIKLVLGHPVIGAVGIDWALTPDEASKLRDYLTKALEEQRA